MKNTFEDIRDKLTRRIYLNEEHIRFSLVSRILSELGWDIWNPKEVYTEFPVVRSEDNTKVDVALFLMDNIPRVYIEIKSHTKIEQNLPDIERQLRNYNRDNTAIFTIITDGQHWRFYFSQTGGGFSDKCYSKIDLIKDDSQQLEDEFTKLLSKEKISNGEAENTAKKYLELTLRQRAIKDSLAEANERMDRYPFPNKVQAIQECVTEKGYQVDSEEVIEFLKNVNLGSSRDLPLPNVSLRDEGEPAKRKEPFNISLNEQTDWTILKVSINGRTFQQRDAIDTYISVIEFLGVERIKNNVQVKSKYPLIIKKNELSKYSPGKFKQIANGYCVYSNNSTPRKKQFLDEIGRQLREKMTVEIVSK